LFADDCLLYKEINNISDGQDLQNDLKALESLERREKVTAQGLFLEARLNLRM
jgi:hypothetical protein